MNSMLANTQSGAMTEIIFFPIIQFKTVYKRFPSWLIEAHFGLLFVASEDKFGGNLTCGRRLKSFSSSFYGLIEI